MHGLRGPVQLLITNLERCVRLLRGIATGPYTIKTRGSRLGSLYYSITNLTLDLPAALACDIDVVVEGAPVVVVVRARKDGLAIRESVLSFILPGYQPQLSIDRRAGASSLSSSCRARIEAEGLSGGREMFSTVVVASLCRSVGRRSKRWSRVGVGNGKRTWRRRGLSWRPRGRRLPA